MTRARTQNLPASIRAADCAFFLDFDGTLADLAQLPSMAVVSHHTRRTLSMLGDATQGAVAIVTGRPIAQIDALLAPQRIPVAGSHGAERRGADGRLHAAPVDSGLLVEIEALVAGFIKAHDGLLCETKPASVALHFRLRPDLEPQVDAFSSALMADRPGVRLMPGKMVREYGASPMTKGNAVDAFMAEVPFSRRVPVFCGDDVTDEDGFAAVLRRSGFAVKVGDGPTVAPWRARDAGDCRRWLAEIAGNRTDMEM